MSDGLRINGIAFAFFLFRDAAARVNGNCLFFSPVIARAGLRLGECDSAGSHGRAHLRDGLRNEQVRVGSVALF